MSINDLRKATKEELLNEWHKTRKELSKTLDNIDTFLSSNV